MNVKVHDTLRCIKGPSRKFVEDNVNKGGQASVRRLVERQKGDYG